MQLNKNNKISRFHLINFIFTKFQMPETIIDKDKPSEKVEKVDIDINSLSVKAQWKLLKQESPELRELVSDFKVGFDCSMYKRLFYW